MIKITLPDGSVKEFNSGITPAEVALSISEGLRAMCYLPLSTAKL